MFWHDRKFTAVNPATYQVMEEVADAVRERLQGLDARIDALEAEVAALKREPRQSLAAKLREKGIKT